MEKLGDGVTCPNASPIDIRAPLSLPGRIADARTMPAACRLRGWWRRA